MPLFAQILVGLVALIRLYILWLEMFTWTKRGPQTLRSLLPSCLHSSRY